MLPTITSKLQFFGHARIRALYLPGGGGGGISNYGELALTNSNVSGNSASDFNAGGIFNDNKLTLTDCTISGNSANGSGGGVYSYYGQNTLTNCTLSGNSAQNGGGIFEYAGTVTLANTIIAGNTGGSGPDVKVRCGRLNSLGYNLIGDPSGSTGWASTDILNVNPLLSPLGNYGGPTETMALLPGSPAIGAGNVAFITDPPFPGPSFTDQRGVPRVIDGKVDIGAFESQGFTIAYSSGSGQSATVDTNFGAPLVVSVTGPFGEPVAGGVVTFAPPSSGASCSLPGGSDIAAINSSGLAGIDVAANTTAGGPYRVVSATTGAFGGASFDLTNTAGTPSRLVIHTEPPSTVTAGEAFNPAPVIYIEDRYCNLVTGDNTTQVTASLACGNGPLQGTTTVTAAGGVAVFSSLADDQIETIKLAFDTNTDLPAVTSSRVVVQQGPPAALVIHTEPSPIATAGQLFASQPVVYVVDQFGRLETGDNSTQVAASLRVGNGPLLGTTTISVSGGIATFTNLADDRAENIVLLFTSNGLDKATSSWITVNPAAASRKILTLKLQRPAVLIASRPPAASAGAGRASKFVLAEAVRDRVLGEWKGSLRSDVLAERLARGAGLD